MSSDASEKAKIRLLRRQQFHHQQQQQQQQQKQQQQQQLQLINQADMKRIMALLDENDTKISSWPPQAAQANKQVMDTSTTAYPNHTSTDQEQGFFYSMLNNGNVSHVAEASSNEDNFLWDSLWNLDDVHGNYNTPACATGKASTFHNFVVPFC